MESCPYCGKNVKHFELHFQLYPECYQAWHQESGERKREENFRKPCFRVNKIDEKQKIF
ncbi:MAG: hypothetical protein ACPK85_08260 [Methanosarcina sp.]